jgi:hypothetical protein
MKKNPNLSGKKTLTWITHSFILRCQVWGNGWNLELRLPDSLLIEKNPFFLAGCFLSFITPDPSPKLLPIITIVFLIGTRFCGSLFFPKKINWDFFLVKISIFLVWIWLILLKFRNFFPNFLILKNWKKW